MGKTGKLFVSADEQILPRSAKEVIPFQSSYFLVPLQDLSKITIANAILKNRLAAGQ